MPDQQRHNTAPKGMLTQKRQASRLAPALWFGTFGLIATFVMYGVPAWQRGLVEITLYIVSPTLAAMVAGYLLGATIADPIKTSTLLGAAGKGVLVSVVALVLHSVLFSALYTLTHQHHQVDVPGLFVATLGLGALAVGPVILIAGIGCAVLLNLRARRNG